MAEEAVEVVMSFGDDEVLAGRLWFHRGGRTEAQTFSYDAAYLGVDGAYALDPALPLTAGSHHTAAGRATFGAFSDCAPDRWGRRLIDRAERKRAVREGGAPRSFSESNYLLGVRDDLRQGALRFRNPTTQQFLAPLDSGVPSLLQLPTQLTAAEREERDEETEEELATLLRGGSSLGGARPKAHVIDDAGRLAIAKFPSPASDEWDVMRWEAIALQLARVAGIRVPDFKLHLIDEKSVLVVGRFDRTNARRIGYASALTMLDLSDGQRGSYLEIADAIERSSPSASDDLLELWRRVAFSVLISNFDDHLRNHGFLRESSSGWSLSPAFDLNPDPRAGERHLTTAIDFDNTEARVGLLMEVAREFRLNDQRAAHVLREVYEAVLPWRDVALRCGARDGEIDRLAPAFEHEAKREASRLLHD